MTVKIEPFIRKRQTEPKQVMLGNGETLLNNHRPLEHGLALVRRQNFANPHIPAALQVPGQAFRQINRGSGRARSNEVTEFGRRYRELECVTRPDERAFRCPQQRQAGANCFQADAKTLSAKVQQRQLLLLNKTVRLADRIAEELQLQMKGFQKSASFSERAEKEVRAVLLRLAPIGEAAINTIKLQRFLPVLDPRP